MRLKEKSLQNLIEIVHTDYGISLTDQEAEELGFSLLRITRLASLAFARAEEKSSFAQAREKIS